MDSHLLTRIVSASDLIPGWMSREELVWLAERAASSVCIIEIGSWKGRSTKALAGATSGVVYAIDHWMGQSTNNIHGGRGATNIELDVKGSEAVYAEFCSNLKEEIALSKVVVIRASSMDAAQVFKSLSKDKKADMVFIDADHDYDRVKDDIRGYQPLLSSGALLCGHDYGNPSWPGVKQAVQELLPGYQRGPGTLWHIKV